MIVYTQPLHLACKTEAAKAEAAKAEAAKAEAVNVPDTCAITSNDKIEFMITVCYPLCMVIITVYTLDNISTHCKIYVGKAICNYLSIVFSILSLETSNVLVYTCNHGSRVLW